MQEQIALSKQNVKLQEDVLKIVQARFELGTATELDVDQAQTTLLETKATIPQFEIALRQTQNALCTLLGIPPTDLRSWLGERPIPAAPREAVVGIPAQLLVRRPDVRRAERRGGAVRADRYRRERMVSAHLDSRHAGLLCFGAGLSQLFTPASQYAAAGPTFQWNILNYGRIANNVCLQDARFQEALLNHRAAVLNASQEAENGLVGYLKAQERSKLLRESVAAANKAYHVVVDQYQAGKADFTTVSTIELALRATTGPHAQSLAEIDLNLIQVYRALGGGWEFRLGPGHAARLPPPISAQREKKLAKST